MAPDLILVVAIWSGECDQCTSQYSAETHVLVHVGLCNNVFAVFLVATQA
jgi:hypothetical protein